MRPWTNRAMTNFEGLLVLIVLVLGAVLVLRW